LPLVSLLRLALKLKASNSQTVNINNIIINYININNNILII